MKTPLEKDPSGNWNTIPPVPDEKKRDVNCHKFVLYVIGKISWEDMVSDSQTQREMGNDFTFGKKARELSDIEFTLTLSFDDLLLVVNQYCRAEGFYVGQIRDAKTGEMAHSFIIQKQAEKHICFDKPGFKYPFAVSDLETIWNFTNKDNERSNQNQEWRFVSISI